MQLTDEQLVSICEAELANVTTDGDLSGDRSQAMDYYLGDVSSNIATPKDRSGVVARDVLDTVESVLPSLMRIFVDAENAVEFLPDSKEDEEQSRLETDAVRTIFYEQNEGFLTLYSFIKDALISKNGIIKSSWEEPEWEREEYKGLDPIELDKLLLDQSYKYEIIDMEETEKGIDLTIKVQRKKGRVRCEVITPEEFGISRDATSPNPKKAGFTYHKTQKTASELIEMGFDRKVVEDLPDDSDASGQESLARRNLSDETDLNKAAHKSMQKIWVTECYIYVDRNDDGIAELLKVTLASAGSGSKLLDVDEVDSVPFVAACPVILTHKFYGYSLADLVMDIQEIRTVLLRGILDNVYLSNNVRMGANEKVNLDDLLTSRPGGVVRTKGNESPGNHLTPIQHPPLPAQTFGMLEILDGIVKNRTGIGDEVMGLDTDALANINTGVIAQAYDMARMRIELMARIIAEIGLKELFSDIRELLHKNQSESIQLKINNNWVDVNPAGWREDRNCRVVVGLGHHTKERKLLALNDVMGLQEKLFSTGYVTEKHIHNAVDQRVKAQGLNTDDYFANPENYQPPEKGPGIEEMRLQLEVEKVKIEREKAQIDGQVKIAMAEAKARDQQLKSSVDAMKAQMDTQRMAINEQSQIMQANTDEMKAQHDVYMSEREQSWKEFTDMIKLELEGMKVNE